MMAPAPFLSQKHVDHVRRVTTAIADNIEKVIIGKRDTILLMLAAFLARGHVLIEDVPGTGKTKMAKALAASLDVSFSRVQFTPDLLPSDLTGIHFFNQKTGDFVFRPGPLFTHVLLADEINRATARTQSSLLECMEERQISVGGETTRLDEPFMVIATQNPIETHGTFPLPEAQLDRFIMQLSVGYPSTTEENEMLERFRAHDPLSTLQPVANKKDFLDACALCEQLYISEPVKDFLLSIVRATRHNEQIQLGASPRASIALMRTAQACAAIDSRTFVTPDDVLFVAPAVLSHRLMLNAYDRFSASQDALSVSDRAKDVLTNVIRSVACPTEPFDR